MSSEHEYNTDTDTNTDIEDDIERALDEFARDDDISDEENEVIPNGVDNEGENNDEGEGEDNDEGEGEKTCSVCYNPINGDNAVNTPCNHAFCSSCFFRWFKLNRTCPLCRQDLVSKESITMEDIEIEETRLLRTFRDLEKKFGKMKYIMNILFIEMKDIKRKIKN